MPTRKIIKLFKDTNIEIQSSKNNALCYGHFNVIHPGHIRFLQHAKTLADKLIIAIMGDKYIHEEQRKKIFVEIDRAEGIASLQIVDTVYILSEISLAELILKSKPSVLVLGKEFEKSNRKDIQEAIQAMESISGKIHFHAGDVHYASSEFLHGSQQEIEEERRHLFFQACKRHEISSASLVNRIQKFVNTKILVIGDTIVDQYVACDAIGMSAEAPVLVVKEIESREFVGGAGIVASHVKALGAECKFLSVVGMDENAEVVKKDLESRNIQVHLLKDESRPTTFKIRYMVQNQKLFRVSRMKEHTLPQNIEDELIQKLWELSDNIDGILVCDFVYGVITPRIVEELQKISKQKNLLLFGDLQCSSQVGNIAKFENFNLLCPTEREARIALSNQQDGIEWIANTLIDKTKTKNLLIKLGSEGFIAYGNESSDNFVNREHFPALISNPVDVAGAGDSLLSALSVSMCSGGSLMESSAIGACMAALAVQTIGNIPVTREKLENFIRRLEFS